jgi:hypothetical protein
MLRRTIDNLCVCRRRTRPDAADLRGRNGANITTDGEFDDDGTPGRPRPARRRSR